VVGCVCVCVCVGGVGVSKNSVRFYICSSNAHTIDTPSSTPSRAFKAIQNSSHTAVLCAVDKHARRNGKTSRTGLRSALQPIGPIGRSRRG
jgi:hypothetical protein